ncbi:MAG TPA: endonuclease domain-containing protein [Bauldia sp.]|nr:endonuclease domain-containing protein [Bauldia sp.]
MGEPEIRFWTAVRAHRFHKLGFRRQVPIAGYIVDFVCHERRLVIEIDGDSHASTQAQDELRSMRLAEEGFRVVRFWNDDVIRNLDGVLEHLAEVLAIAEPPSQPSPTRGEGAKVASPRT